MATFCFSAPILPGKMDTWRNFIDEMKGPRRMEYDASRRRAGISREAAWLQRTPNGEEVVVLWEVEDPQRAFETLANSQEPFDVWNRQIVKEVHGWDLSQVSPVQMIQPVLDWIAPGSQAQQRAA